MKYLKLLINAAGIAVWFYFIYLETGYVTATFSSLVLIFNLISNERAAVMIESIKRLSRS